MLSKVFEEHKFSSESYFESKVRGRSIPDQGRFPPLGSAQVGEAGSEGFGTILSGSLERSNVDITEELVNLITAQRNFQASAKAIETTTTLTQTIINIRM